MALRILVLNGPNLNLLGQREPDVYGTQTLHDVELEVATYAEEELNAGRSDERRIELQFFQSNHEGLLIDTIQASPRNYAGIVYNPAAHTHYSIAIRDAIAAVPTPVVEVHLSDIAAREEFRHTSVMTDVCLAQYKGEGATSYKKGLKHLVDHLDAQA
jgi:3-dehydroquinate dehydratase-2